MGFTLPSFWRATTPPTTAQLNEQRALDATATLELEGALAPQSKTITDGSISPTAAYVIVDTEGSAPADDLEVISPVLSASENLHDGMVLYLKAADSGRVVTVKNSSSANGINTYDGNDYVLSTTHWLKLQLRSGKWYEVEGRAMETALAAVVAAANAATAADHAQTKSGTSSTASGTAAKVVTCAGFELSTNARIFVTFSNANTVADAITINVNGTGAKSVYNQTGIVSASNTALFAANQPIEFRYDGTGWVFYDAVKSSSVITSLASKANVALDNISASGQAAIRNIAAQSDRRGGTYVSGVFPATLVAATNYYYTPPADGRLYVYKDNHGAAVALYLCDTNDNANPLDYSAVESSIGVAIILQASVKAGVQYRLSSTQGIGGLTSRFYYPEGV